MVEKFPNDPFPERNFPKKHLAQPSDQALNHLVRKPTRAPHMMTTCINDNMHNIHEHSGSGCEKVLRMSKNPILNIRTKLGQICQK